MTLEEIRAAIAEAEQRGDWPEAERLRKLLEATND